MMSQGRVLIVDDNLENLEVLTVYLKMMGFTSASARREQAAYNLVTSFDPDLIVLDVRLGETNGLDICKKLKSSANTESISIMLMTGFSDDQMIEDAIASGADDVLFKPFAMPLLVMRVKNLVKLAQLTKKENKLADS
jgi:DNA-binding response OmpR family regulator